MARGKSQSQPRPPALDVVRAPQRRLLPHATPPWVRSDAVFFITLNCRPRGENQLCDPAIAQSLFESVSFRQNRGDWFVHLMLLMPDHLHALISFPREREMKQVVAKWKEFAAKRLRLHWQRDFFDHRLRGEESYEEKAHYIRMNPVRKQLACSLAEWPYVWEPSVVPNSGGPSGPALPT